MNITLNAEPTEVADGATVADVVASLAIGSQPGVAVAVDRSVIPRSRWAESTVTAGARVDVVTAVQGG